MSPAELIYVAVLSIAFVLGVARGVQRRGAARRREADRQAYRDSVKADRASKREAKIAGVLEHYFPYVEDEVKARVTAGQAPKKALREAIRSVDGVILGATEFGVDLLLPEVWRTRHVQIWGRSGGGKSVCMTHMLLSDIEHPERGAIVVVCPEPELHMEVLGRAQKRDVIYLAVGDPRCSVALNPFRRDSDSDPIDRHAAALFSALKSCLGESKIGPRSDPLLANAISLALHDPQGTLLTVRQLLTDAAFRERLLHKVSDPYLKQFWAEAGANVETTARPVLSRLDAYLRNPSIRQALTHVAGSFTMREVVEGSKVLLVDTSGLGSDDAALVTSLIVTLLRLELFRREAALTGSPPPVRLYIDEWASVVNVGNVEEFSTLLMRSRKYNCSIVLAGQFPAQVAVAVRQQVAGNVSNCLVLGLGAKDASSIRHELLRPRENGQLKPIDPADLVQATVGVGYARIGSGCAVKVKFKPPEATPAAKLAERVRAASWKRYAAPADPGESSAPLVGLELGAATVSAPAPVRPSPAMTGQQTEASDSVAAAPAIISTPKGSSAQPRPTRRTPTRSALVRIPANAGRGGREHKYLAALVQQFGRSRNFRATIEKRIKNGSVDVALEKDTLSIAVEISVTSSPDHELDHVMHCLAADFDHVVVISKEARQREKIEARIAEAITDEQRERVHCFAPEALFAFIDEIEANSDGDDSTVRGYRVKVEYGTADEHVAQAKQKAITEVLASTLKRMKD